MHLFVSAVHELKLVLPLKREKGNSNCGEIEIELNDLHMQLPGSNSTTESDGHIQDNRTASTTSGSAAGTQNGPTSTAVAAGGVASGVASLANDVNLMQLETPEPQRRTGSVSQATTTSSTATARATPTASTALSSANGSAQTTTSPASDRQSVLAVPGIAGVAAVGGAATTAAATGGNARVPTPTSPAPNPPQRTPTPQVLGLFLYSMIQYHLVDMCV